VPVLSHHPENEVLGSDNERGPNEVPVHGVPPGASASFYFNDHAEFVMDSIDLISHPLSTTLSEEHRTADLLSRTLTSFNFVTKFLETWPYDSEDRVASEAVDLCGVDLVGDVSERSDHAQHPLLRHRRRRVAAPDRILPHAQSSAAPAGAS
jgi:hypothetical protein